MKEREREEKVLRKKQTGFVLQVLVTTKKRKRRQNRIEKVGKHRSCYSASFAKEGITLIQQMIESQAS